MSRDEKWLLSERGAREQRASNSLSDSNDLSVYLSVCLSDRFEVDAKFISVALHPFFVILCRIVFIPL